MSGCAKWPEGDSGGVGARADADAGAGEAGTVGAAGACVAAATAFLGAGASGGAAGAWDEAPFVAVTVGGRGATAAGSWAGVCGSFCACDGTAGGGAGAIVGCRVGLDAGGAWEEVAGVGVGASGAAGVTAGALTAFAERGDGPAGVAVTAFFGADALDEDGMVIELDDGRVRMGATVGCAGAGRCGTLSLILVGCSPALAYAGMEKGSGRSDMSFLK